jgi:hypothetical protein
MSESRRSYLDLVVTIVTLVAGIISIVTSIGNALGWPGAKKLLVASVAGYALFAGGVFWFAFKYTEVDVKWRRASLVVLYVITILYFGWVGTRIEVSPASDWPPDLVTYYDFETDADLEGWTSGAQRSTEHAFSGRYALKAIQPVQAGQDTSISLHWQHEFTADVIVGQVYWPEDDEVGILWAQVCVPLWGWDCAGLPRNRGGWNTFVLDLSEMSVGDPPQPLDQLVLPGLHFQGGLRGRTSTSVTTFLPMYVDAIQIYHDGKK